MTYPHRWLPLHAIVICLMLLPGEPVEGVERALSCSLGHDKVVAYYAYINDNLCWKSGDTDCLEPTSYIATRSDGRRVRVRGVYRWKKEHDTWKAYGESEARPQYLPHFMHQYMKQLSGAYGQCPALHQHVYDQIDYAVSEGVDRNGALVWENRLGYAQGMEQGEMGLMLAKLAVINSQHGFEREARGTMRYALRAARPLFRVIGVRNGGLRSRNQDACAAKTARLRPCFWFHSRGRSVDSRAIRDPDVNTVLNQHLHVLRDVLDMSVELRYAGQLAPNDLPPPVGSSWADALEDRVIGGLYQLAYSNGHNAHAPTRPPNLAQFMNRHSFPLPFYSAYYNFDIATGRRLEDSQHYGTCHYQSHSMNVLAAIYRRILAYTEGGDLSPEQGWRLDEAIHRLLEGAGEAVGLAGSTHAAYQFYRTEEPRIRNTPWRCPTSGIDTLSADAYGTYSAIFGPWQPSPTQPAPPSNCATGQRCCERHPAGGCFQCMPAAASCP